MVARQVSECWLAHVVTPAPSRRRDAAGGSGGTTRSMMIAAPVSGATSFNRCVASVLDPLRRFQRFDLEPQMPVDFFFVAALFLHLLHAIAVLQQLDALPAREQQHADKQHADGHRSPLLLQTALVNLADDRVVPHVFLDGVFKCFGRCAHKPSASALGSVSDRM